MLYISNEEFRLYCNKGFDNKPNPVVTDKYMDIRASSSEKKKGSDERVYSNWNCRAIGHAKNSLASLKPGDVFTITKCKLTNESYKDKDGVTKSACRIVILEAYIGAPGSGETKTEAHKKADSKPVENTTVTEEEEPW